MNTFLKKILCVIISFILCMELSITALASESVFGLREDEKASLFDVINDIEYQKDLLGLSDVNFNELCIGAPVQTYIYKNDTFENGIQMYPITINNNLIFWAIKYDGKFQVTTALTSEVNDKIDANTPFSIIFDKNSSYLFVDGEFVFLRESDIEDDTRSVISTSLSTLNDIQDADILTTTLSANCKLNYSGSVARVSNYYGCNVSFVSQNPPSNLCWAATIACIVNYKKGTSLSAVSVAQGYYGSGDYNYGLNISYVPGILANYGLSYSYQNITVTSNVILTNLMNDYPIYSSWVYPGGAHAVCIYGVNPVGGYLYIMNPASGFTSATATEGGYTYVSSNSGATLQLYRAVCHNW